MVDYNMEQQVGCLLEKPLHGTSLDRQRPPLVLVIDALDKCTDAEEVKQLMNKLLSVCKDLPVNFFLTSHPQPHVVRFELNFIAFFVDVILSRIFSKQISHFILTEN